MIFLIHFSILCAEVMSFSVETSDAEEMLEIFKKNADSPGYINE